MKPTHLSARLDRTTVAWSVLAVLAAIFFYIHSSFAQDDAYITYRYARNLSHGLGFVYNVNQPVLGTTTPLYTLVLAAGAVVTRLDVVTISLIVGLLSVWIGAGALYQLGQARSKSLALAAALIYVTNPFLSQFVGMESYFLLGLFLVAAWAYAARRLWLVSLLCGLLVLVRYEMVLFVVLVAILDFRSQRQPPIWLLPGLVPVLLWIAFAWVTFGSPIPLSAQAKLSAPHVPFPLGAALYEYFFVSTVPPDFAFLILFVLGLMAALIVRRLPERYALVILFGLLYFCVVSAVAGSFPWYYAPLIPAFAVLAASGLRLASEIPGAFLPGWKAKPRIGLARWLLIAAVVFIQLLFWVNDYQLRQRQDFDHRYAPFQEVSQWLNQNAAPHQSLAAFEIGYVGYFTDMTIIDFAGLVTPGLLAWVKDGSNVTLTQCLRLYAPDYVLIPSDDAPQIVIIGQDSRYELEREFMHAYQLYGKADRKR